MSQNISKSEIHGCVVCGRLFYVLAVYTPGGELVDFTMTNPGGRLLQQHGRHPLVACTSHSATEVDHALEKWSTRVTTEEHEKE